MTTTTFRTSIPVFVGHTGLTLPLAAGAMVYPDRPNLTHTLLKTLREVGEAPNALLVTTTPVSATHANAEFTFTLSGRNDLAVQARCESRFGCECEKIDGFEVYFGKESTPEVPIPLNDVRGSIAGGTLRKRKFATVSMEGKIVPYYTTGPLANALVSIPGGRTMKAGEVFYGTLAPVIEISPRLMGERLAALIGLSGVNIEHAAFQTITFGKNGRLSRWALQVAVSFSDEAALSVLDGRIRALAELYGWWRTPLERWNAPGDVY